ncbi:MAG: hypothetical protein RL095_872 [Verrucomicrobiota bacterium]|jgi:SAM-dependent methyltransferase
MPLPSQSIDHPCRGRFNAALLGALDGYLHRHYRERKQKLLGALEGTLVELGPGAGANLRYLPRGSRLIAIEPNLRMHPALRRRAEECGIEVDLRTLRGESMDLPDASVDTVFATLVLCSVGDPAAVLAEVKRVLRPGGRFLCLEHVRAETGALRPLQSLLRPGWRWLFEGCDLCRDTGSLLRQAGFAELDIETFALPTLFLPLRPQIQALCRK